MKRLFAVFTALVTVCIGSVTALAYGYDALSEGTYQINTELSCYVNAMGGVEFSNGYGLLTGTTVTVAENGTATATVELGTTSGLAVFGVACTAFIGIDEAPGYYKDGAVTKENVTYTTSSDTVANANGQVIITLPPLSFP